MASLIKSGKRYYVQFYNKDKTPKRKQVPTGTSSKTLAIKIFKKLEAEYLLNEFDPWKISNEGINESHGLLYMHELIESYVDYKSTYDWRPNTVITNKYMLGLASEIMGKLKLINTTENDFNEFINHGEKAHSTRLGYRSRLITFIIWAKEFDYLIHIKTKKLKVFNSTSGQTNCINYFSPQDINKLKQFIRQKVNKDIEIGTQSLNRNALWLIDFIDWQRISGLRLSETLNLRVSDINFDTWEITIGNNEFKPKSNKKKILPVGEVYSLKNILKKLVSDCKSESDLVFGHTSRRHTHRLFKKYLRLAIPKKTNLNIHSLRHTCCIELLKAGTPIYTVQRWLRHADVKTTQRYADILNIDLSKEIARVFDRN